jgi:glycosyltransferase involved in cell wall biosynthesis
VQTAVESILNQTYTDFEFLIIDDASTDATTSIIKSYTDTRIKILEKSVNSGYTNSLNYGLKISKGEYIARMDGDDISFPERFAKQLAFLEANPDIIVCGTTYKIIGSEKKIRLPEKHKDITIELLKGNCIAHPSVMIRKERLDAFSIQYDNTREPAEDYDMWIRLLAIGKLHNLQEVLLEYRLYSNQVSRKRAEEQINNDIKSKFKLLEYLGVSWNDDEYKFLERNFKKIEKIDFKDIKEFKQIQKKLAEANGRVGFFGANGFKQYLIDLEADVLRKCFLKQKRYSPLLYLDYLNSKWKWGASLSTKKEILLGIKSIFFFETQKRTKKK